MKILQVLPEMNAGGVERGTLEIASFLVAHGHQASVVSNGGRMVSMLENTGARHLAMPLHRKSLATLVHVPAMRNYLTTERPDIVHIRSRVPGWIVWLAWRGMDPLTRPRLVSTVHGFYSVNRYSAIMTRGERVIAVSASTRDYILKNYPNTPRDIIRVIPRGIDPSAYHVDYRPNDPWLADWQHHHPGLAGKCLLLLPGRITRLKGHEDFFKLIAALKLQGIPAHGLVAGEAHPNKRAYLDELRARVRGMKLDADITFLGHRSDLRDVMAVSHLVCALSQQPESFGRTTLEALALGKPVVGYQCGGVGELLEEFSPFGKAPPGDIGRIIDAAASIIRDKPVPAAVGERYTLDAMCRGTLAVYQELDGRRG
jgi:glycosyltransferase involved in cell wall biosynthesis